MSTKSKYRNPPQTWEFRFLAVASKIGIKITVPILSFVRTPIISTLHLYKHSKNGVTLSISSSYKKNSLNIKTFFHKTCLQCDLQA